MRWFWLVVALLAAIGLWIVLSPAPSTPTPLPEPSTTSIAEPTTTPPAPDLDLLGESGVVIPAKPIVVADTRSPNDIVKRLDDRTLELDGRFRITGNGRVDDPYRISWELLTSASSTIDPTTHALTPPPWVRLLDGTSIEISGYYSTALRVSSARNLLLTLNRWDGCCIGLPPTPFDAIDMTMREPIPMPGLHLFRFGTFRGRLVVEPFETGGFLLGLYRLEDATFESAR